MKSLCKNDKKRIGLVGRSLADDCSGARELATLFIAETADELPEETEQPLFWVTEKELREGPLAGSLAELFPVFFGEKQFYFKNNTA